MIFPLAGGFYQSLQVLGQHWPESKTQAGATRKPPQMTLLCAILFCSSRFPGAVWWLSGKEGSLERILIRPASRSRGAPRSQHIVALRGKTTPGKYGRWLLGRVGVWLAHYWRLSVKRATVDGRSPALLKKPWKDYSPANPTNNGFPWFPSGFPQYGIYVCVAMLAPAKFGPGKFGEVTLNPPTWRHEIWNRWHWFPSPCPGV